MISKHTRKYAVERGYAFVCVEGGKGNNSQSS